MITGYGLNFRAMWHPGRMVAVGLVSGYLFIAEDNITRTDIIYKASARLNAVPLQCRVSMQ